MARRSKQTSVRIHINKYRKLLDMEATNHQLIEQSKAQLGLIKHLILASGGSITVTDEQVVATRDNDLEFKLLADKEKKQVEYFIVNKWKGEENESKQEAQHVNGVSEPDEISG